MKPLAAPLLGLALAVGAAAAAQAHAKLISADPPANGVAKAPPRSLNLTFSEPVSEKLSGVVVKGPHGAAVPASTMAQKGGEGLTVMMKAPLKPGAYAVAWHAVASDDGHRTSGTYSFTVP